jgi:hypothetical protein
MEWDDEKSFMFVEAFATLSKKFQELVDKVIIILYNSVESYYHDFSLQNAVLSWFFTAKNCIIVVSSRGY